MEIILDVQMSVNYSETYYLEKSLTDAYTYDSGKQHVTYKLRKLPFTSI